MSGGSQESQVVELINGIDVEKLLSNEAARTAAVAAAQKLLTRLQRPAERVFHVLIEQPVVFPALQTLSDLGLFKAWYEAGGGEKSIAELLKLTNVDVEENLLRRLLRLVASVHMIDETGEDKFQLNDTTRWIGDNESKGLEMMKSDSHHWMGGCANLPSFLKKTGYRDPLDPSNTSYKDASPEKTDFWTRCSQDPTYQKSFTSNMEVWSRTKIPWPEFYDTKALLAGADLSGATALVVDVGGNIGNDISRFLAENPDVPDGSLILQDRAEAVRLAPDLGPKIRVMGHDMFTPQPVHGARAYYLHAVLHDWADREGIQILQNLRPAMRKGYSRLLINDIVIPDTGASSLQASMDVQMMTLLNAFERTEKVWRKIVTDSGFKVMKIWKDPIGYESLIEAELA